MIYGNIDGIRNVVLDRLESLLEVKVPKDELVTYEIVSELCEITGIIDREISIAIDRKGKVIGVAIGDSNTVELPQFETRDKKLSGVRIIHTHPNGNPRLSALDTSALLKLRLDAIVALGVLDGEFNGAIAGFCMIKENSLITELSNTMDEEDIKKFDLLDKINHIEELIKINEVIDDNTERAVLVGIESEESLEELEELARACDVKVSEKILQKRERIDTATFVGSGKVEEISLICQAVNANLIIIDDELSGSQVRNLEENTGVKVIDRTTLILEIFAKRAKSRDGKIQVELAQLKYRLSRLAGLGTVLSRTGGGIGTRGPGEKKLETDRRHIKERIYDLLKELEKVRKNRETQRENRSSLPKVSLVGYTNAGKSTLRNALCDLSAPKDIIDKEKVFEADMLFATLDTTTRAIVLKDNRTAALTDTVGFIRKLPHDLVEAFKSTLEEVVYSDLLLHVVDSSSEHAIEQIEAVNGVLSELGALDKEILLVLNKVDKASLEQIEKIEALNSKNKIIKISAKEGKNLNELLTLIGESIPSTLREVELLIPYAEGAVLAFIHRNGKVIEEDYKDDGNYVKAIIDEEVYNKCIKYVMK